jgi:hypothetical protein
MEPFLAMQRRRAGRRARPLRLVFLAAAILALCSQPLHAQTPAPAGVFDNITIGEPMAQLHATFGDPIRVLQYGQTVIWRYLTHGGGLYTDVIVKDNLAQSVTVLRRISSVRYAAPTGASFGMSPGEVRAKFGAATREATNADDGSLDLTYVARPFAWIYEFHANSLDFIQLVAAPSLLATFPPGSAVTPNDGTSLARAIWIRPSNVLSDTVWIDAFLAENPCGGGGQWKQTSSKLAADQAADDPIAYMIVHARCSAGNQERDFYFDTHGAARSNGNPTTIYVETNQLPDAVPSPAPSPSSSPSGPR